MSSDYLSLEALAVTLSLPQTYLKRLIDSGKLPYIDTGNGRKRFQESAVREALSQMEQEAVVRTDTQRKVDKIFGTFLEEPV